MGSLVLYMVLTVLSAGLCFFIQTLGKEFLGQWSGFLFAGDSFRYNYVMYVIGLAIFCTSLILMYKYIVQKKLETYSINKVAAVIVVILMCIVMFAALVFVSFVILGMNSSLKPEVLFYITIFGWPMGTMIYMFVRLMLDL